VISHQEGIRERRDPEKGGIGKRGGISHQEGIRRKVARIQKKILYVR
jgi:hypothetical protein